MASERREKNICLVIAYDGTAYSGWQYQPDVPTVQGAIEQALHRMTQSQARLRGAGRTDAGVHAEEQVANVRLKTRLSCHELYQGLNALVPPDVAIRAVKEVSFDFDARRDNAGKHYRYGIWNGRQRLVSQRQQLYFCYKELNIDKMARAAHCFVGQHDFVAFRAADCDRLSTVRTLYRCSIHRDGALICIDVEGTAFLKHMVRIVAGTLVAVGLGRLSVQDVGNLLKKGLRPEAGMTLPPHGLTLMRVFV